MSRRTSPDGAKRLPLKGLLTAAGVDFEADADADISGLAYDSRRVEAGDLFCCIPGAVVDGHGFARAAVEAGAAALLVERPVGAGVPEARVERVRAVCGPLADAFFDHPSAAVRVAGVTGTNGKTTVTYLLESIVEAAGLRPGVIGTVHYRVGDADEQALRTTPEAIDLQRLLARMRDASTDVVAIEVASHALDQDRVRSIGFACAGFTNLTHDHLDYHGDMESYFEAKAKLFEMTERAVVNAADPYGRRLLDRLRSLDVLAFGAPGADVVLTEARYTPGGIRATVSTPAGPLDVRTNLFGPHNASNVLCAIGMSLQLGLEADGIVEGVARLQRVPGRLERVTDEPCTVLIDYAHTPDALERAIAVARGIASGRLTVVFGCGGDRDRSKRPLMGEVATRGADLAILTSDNPRSEEPMAIIEEIREGAERGGGPYEVVTDRRDAIAVALRGASPEDVVLVAGKGHERGQTIGETTMPFDDREVVMELVSELSCRG